MEINTTVIIPVLNGEHFIDRALNSILFQSIPLDEILIINDGSFDKTEEKVLDWKNKLPINYYKNKLNMGVPFSLRKGISMTNADLIFRLDIDDEWNSNHVENLLKLVHKDKNAVLFASRANFYNKQNKLIKQSQLLLNHTIRKDLQWDNPIVHSSVAFRKEDYFKTIGYSNFKYAHDYSLFIELLNIGKLSFSKEASVNYYFYENSLSHKSPKESLMERLKNQWRAIHIFAKIDIFYSLKIIPILILRAIFKM